MPSGQQIAEENDAILAELATLCLGSARDLQARQLAAEDAGAAAGVAQALHRVARSIRQTAALRSKLARDLKQGLREDRDDTQRQEKARLDKRKAKLKAALGRLIWDEYEADEAEALDCVLEERLDEEALADHFATEPLDAQIARIRDALGLIPPPGQSPTRGRWPEGPEGASAALSSPSDPDDDDYYWRSSA